MTDLGQSDDGPEEKPLSRLAIIGGTLLAILSVCAALPLCGHLKVACYVVRLATAPGAAFGFGWLHRRWRRQLAGARAVSDAVKGVLLRPLPPRIGGLVLASVYRASGGQARVGGDLYAVARADASTRIIIGDVRGRGLSSFLDVIAILGAFREWAPQAGCLAELSSHLEESFVRYLAEADDGARSDVDERFATALVLDVPDGGLPARMVNFGHPPPIRARPGEVALLSGTPCPPLGLSTLCDVRAHENSFEFGPRDTLLLYTDGLIEARDCVGAYFPLLERAATWMWNDRLSSCHERLRHVLGEILEDIVDYCGAMPADDLAMIALARRIDGGTVALPHPQSATSRKTQGPPGRTDEETGRCVVTDRRRARAGSDPRIGAATRPAVPRKRHGRSG
ncbi:PP2C family protein-serine/threonine phosphatase [Streptomyces sp. NPDC001953]